MTQWHIEQQPFPAQIIPAYERLINQVPADATRVATEEAGDSWLFRYIDLHELPRSSHPPSWVPQLFRNVDSAVDPNNFRSTFNASEGMATSYSELFATFDLSLQEHDWRRVIKKNDLGSTKTIHELFRKTVTDKQLTTDEGNDVKLPPLEAMDLGLDLLAGIHSNPEPVVTQHEPAPTFGEFVNTITCRRNRRRKRDNRSPPGQSLRAINPRSEKGKYESTSFDHSGWPVWGRTRSEARRSSVYRTVYFTYTHDYEAVGR
ncbi:hypothetical protein H4I96_09978 [Botrytis cinerea]